MNDMSQAGRTQIDDERLAVEFAALQAALSGKEAMPPGQRWRGPPTRFDRLADTFGLSATDMAIITLAVAADLAPDMLAGRTPVLDTARQLVPDGFWAAICPQAPVRRWRMVEIEGNGAQRDRLLRIDERIRAYLLGVDYLDPRLDGVVALAAPGLPSDEQVSLGDRLQQSWLPANGGGWPVLQLVGGAAETGTAVAAAICAGRGQKLFSVMAADLPRRGIERQALGVLCDREMALIDGVLLIEAEDAHEDDPRAAATFADELRGPVIIVCGEPLTFRRPQVRADLPATTNAERSRIWAEELGEEAFPRPELERLALQFPLAPADIRAAAGAARGGSSGTSPFDTAWDAARTQARGRLDELAERIALRAQWDDLVLPQDRMAQLREVAVHVRRAHQVNHDWGWAARGSRGLGVAALFAGPSGTGKTMAAEVLAGALRLDLYRIDLSQVVSKYIGETEKNLRRIFDAAERNGAILLFDEADALFGKRSEVKDSHDRYANVEVSYLLQRMEAYSGLAILTTNLKGALDSAFMRRLRFVIDFPFPDVAQRAEIWRRVFPPETPMGPDDPGAMARLSVAGGTIRTIAVNAAFLAAEQGEPVALQHLQAAARREYVKLDKPLTASEFGGW